MSRVTLPFDEAIATLNAQTGQSWPADTNAYVAQSSLDDLSDELASDLPTPEIVRETARGDEYGSSLWMGFPPTSTPLHRDPNPNFFVQLAGIKCFRMLDPPNGALVYQTALGRGTGRIRGAEMLVGKESQRMEEWLWGDKTLESPRIEEQRSGRPQIECWEACLNEGDALFIPVGWWHSVRGVGLASSINASVSVECSCETCANSVGQLVVQISWISSAISVSSRFTALLLGLSGLLSCVSWGIWQYYGFLLAVMTLSKY